ncbi:MAG: GIY-YIG nuclease family protein [Proteobacteria bacterium]|nr:GIY-YIG nuclease family protein [Pseudomonadota bacterium]
MSIQLDFKGYFPELTLTHGRTLSGIYVVYAGSTGEDRGSNCCLKKIIYIGKGGNIPDRIKNHECKDCWYQELSPGEQLYFSIAEIPEDIQENTKAILVNLNRPSCNIEFVHSIPECCKEITLSSTGADTLLNSKCEYECDYDKEQT